MSQHKFTKTALLACAVFSYLSYPQTVAAAEDTAYSTGVHYQVVVGEPELTQAEEEAKYEPQKVTIITSKDIEEKQAKTVEDIIFNETGVTRTVDGMGRVGVSIRGAEARHTLLLVDGQPVLGELAKYSGSMDELSRIGAENIDHIEIIQGAASAKYGADAIGGVVNVITKKTSVQPKLQFNLEARNSAVRHPELKDSPYNNFFLRADSGKLGKMSFSVYGNKRDVMPVVAQEARRDVGFMLGTDVSEFPPNALRYWGTNSSIGVMGSYEFNENSGIDFKADHFNENLHRQIKRTNSEMEPILNFKRKADRNTYSINYHQSLDNTDFNIEGNYSELTEDDVAVESKFATNRYEGKNTLNAIDNLEHKQYGFKGSINHAASDNHLLSVTFGYSKEDGKGSRMKSAPNTKDVYIDPWDYDKSLYVTPVLRANEGLLAVTRETVTSRIHKYKFNYENGVPQWDLDGELANYDAKDPNSIKPIIGISEYLNNKSEYNSYMGSGLSPKQKQNKDDFEALLKRENPGQDHWRIIRSYFRDLEADELADPRKEIRLNGVLFGEGYEKNHNKITVGEASIKKYFATVSDTWNMGDDTIFVPTVRFDHSSTFGSHLSASAGVTHNYKGDPNTRLKANIGTGYAEPGMGELYYNWEMFPGTPTGFGKARMGWYWIGNPDLKPEKSINLDLGFEKDMNRTSIKASVFHNKIKDYLSVYFTGDLIDFYPWYNSSSPAGFWKFMNPPDMIYSFKNIGKVEITGADFEVRQKMGKHFQARLGYTYLNARNKSDSSMPAHLLDKPVHKVDIGLNYMDEKRGWSGSLYGNYYIDMLDSNALASRGSYMETYGWGAPHPEIKYFFKEDDKHEYAKKTYGIWNAMIQKKFEDGNTVYFGIDNLFNHHDDARALQEKTYRVGMNFKVTDIFEQKAAINPETGETLVAAQTPFIVKPFDETLPIGANLYGSFRLRNNDMLGENRPSSRIAENNMVSKAANEVLVQAKDDQIESRMEFGLKGRAGKATVIDVLASVSSNTPTDTSAPTYDKGPQNGELKKLEVMQHTGSMDFSIGRLYQDFGATSYWFNNHFDGAKAVYTGEKAQVTVGMGSFKQTTGITDSAYTHANYEQFERPVTLEEFLGIKPHLFDNGTHGGYNKGFTDDDPAKDANPNVEVIKKLGVKLKELSDQHPEFDPPYVWGAPPAELHADFPVEDVLTDLKHIQDLVTAGYGSNPKMYVNPQGQHRGLSAVDGESFPVPDKFLYLELNTKDGKKVFGNYSAIKDAPEDQIYSYSLKEEHVAPGDRKNLAIQMSDDSLFKETTRQDFLKSWWNKNGDNYIHSMENTLRTKLNDDTVTITTDKDAIRQQIVKGLLDPTTRMFNGAQIGVRPEIVDQYVNNLIKALDEVDNGTLRPREGLAATGYFVPMEGTVINQDVIPAIDKALFAEVKYAPNDKLGFTAWHFRSMDDKELQLAHANGTSNDVSTFNNYAKVFGVGAKVQFSPLVSLSVDGGYNVTDFGRHMNGSSLYEHEKGTNAFKLVGHKDGSTPKFWTVRVDLGAIDAAIPGSWNAFVDYKHFEHGSFFGGNGTDALPDRYLDGIQSFTFGAGYVPAKDWLIEGFYTFGAKGINQRDTLFGPENFTLGNYTRAQVTYRF